MANFIPSWTAYIVILAVSAVLAIYLTVRSLRSQKRRQRNAVPKPLVTESVTHELIDKIDVVVLSERKEVPP